MNDEFDLPVDYKGQKHIFKAALFVYGYTHKFKVNINGQEILFEPDEERNYRAVLNYSELDKSKNIDVEILKSIAATLEQLVK